MKRFIFLLFIFPSLVFAEGPVIDPNITPTATITCKIPLLRADNVTPLKVGEIAQVDFYVTQDLTTPIDNWQPAGSNTVLPADLGVKDASCQQVYDLTGVADGQYYYAITATDLQARTSGFSSDETPPDYKAWVVKLAAPNPPTGMAVTFK